MVSLTQLLRPTQNSIAIRRKGTENSSTVRTSLIHSIIPLSTKTHSELLSIRAAKTTKFRSDVSFSSHFRSDAIPCNTSAIAFFHVVHSVISVASTREGLF